MTKPKRIQRKRTKGFKLPPNTICVSRGTRWGNPYTVEVYGRENAIDMYRQSIIPLHEVIKSELKGKNLACFCKENESCHADVLLEIANEE